MTSENNLRKRLIFEKNKGKKQVESGKVHKYSVCLSQIVKKMRSYDLEDRLVKFAISILGVCSRLPNYRLINNLQDQLVRSGISPALMYGEAQAAESRADFIHKLRILLKELRETRISLRIILEKPIMNDVETQQVFMECNELIGIFSASIRTAKSKLAQAKQKDSK